MVGEDFGEKEDKGIREHAPETLNLLEYKTSPSYEEDEEDPCTSGIW